MCRGLCRKLKEKVKREEGSRLWELKQWRSTEILRRGIGSETESEHM